ncbi:MAG TPA: hypothetical protein VF103_00845 [Polyangiaceae bacterium]
MSARWFAPARKLGTHRVFATLRAAVLLHAGFASAEPAASATPAATEPDTAQPTVVLIDPEGSPLARRLQQELEALGFDVEVRSESSRALDDELHAPHAVAAIEVRPARPGQVELVVASPRSAELIRRTLPIEARQDPASAELVATRTVELLRAVRLELDAARHHEQTARGRPPKPTESEPPTASSPQESPGAALATGASVVGAPPFALGASAWLAVALRASPHWSGLAEVSLPLGAMTLERPEGDVDALVNSYRLGAWFESSRTARVGVGVGGGIALEHVSFRGYATAPNVSDDSRFWSFSPWIRVGGALRLSEKLSILLTSTAALSLPTTTVRVAGREVTSFGPSVNAALGVEWAL